MTPDCARVTPDPGRVTPDPARVTPDPARVTPGPVRVTPDRARVTPDCADVTPDPAYVTPDRARVTPHPVRVTPDCARVTPDPADVTADCADVTPDRAHVTPDRADVTPDCARVTLRVTPHPSYSRVAGGGRRRSRGGAGDPRPRLILACMLMLAFATACQGQAPSTPPPSPIAATAPSPSPAAAVPSPSPGLALPSPSASPAPLASPSPAAAETKLQLDDYPFAVIVDNIAEARPHFGFADADVIYEAPAEAGIPRLMPIFLSAGKDVARIGPVRSARHYFVFLANEYRTPLVHIGSSPQGFDALRTTGLSDLDEQRGDDGFVRDPNRSAPHNAFVSTSSVRDVLRQRGGPIRASTGPLNFGAYQPGPQPATTITIPYPGPEGYSVEYNYDPAQEIYERVMDGQPHKDGATGEQYTAKSIVIEFADVEPIPNDDAGRVDIGLVGGGKGILVASGTQVPLQWSRASVRDATQFKRADGAQFVLPSGQVWIQIVPLETQLSVR